GVCAAGDAANYPDLIFEKRRRVEHWDNAISQGQHWAGVVLGDRQPFIHVPYFFSDVFNLSYEFWGDSSGATQTVVRGDTNASAFSVWWLKKNQVVAAFTMIIGKKSARSHRNGSGTSRRFPRSASQIKPAQSGKPYRDHLDRDARSSGPGFRMAMDIG